MAQAVEVSPPYVPFPQHLPREAAIARIAEGQHGVITLGQLRELGLSSSAVRKRAADGRLHRLYRGVFAVRAGHLDSRGKWLAAVFAYGPRALLSHRSAGTHHGILRTARAAIDITVPRGFGVDRPGIDLHRTGTLLTRDVVTVDGIPCTSVARTVVDLGDVVDRRGVERAVEQSEILGLFDRRAVEDALDRAGPRHGAAVLRAVLRELVGESLTANDLEERFLHICREAALPQPAVNQWVAIEGEEWQVDFMWPRERLIVETDGRKTHGTRQAFERDRLRDQRLMLAGWRVVRFTHRQVYREPERVARTVAALLAR